MSLITRCAAELEKLADEKDDVLTVGDVVQFAKDNPGTAVNEWFTKRGAFDPERAMELVQRLLARRLIRRVKVVVQDSAGEGQVVRVRAYQSVISDREDGGGYRPVGAIMGTRPLRDAMLQTALLELQALRKRHQQLSELAGVWSAIDAASRPMRATGT